MELPSLSLDSVCVPIYQLQEATVVLYGVIVSLFAHVCLIIKKKCFIHLHFEALCKLEQKQSNCVYIFYHSFSISNMFKLCSENSVSLYLAWLRFRETHLDIFEWKIFVNAIKQPCTSWTLARVPPFSLKIKTNSTNSICDWVVYG